MNNESRNGSPTRATGRKDVESYGNEEDSRQAFNGGRYLEEPARLGRRTCGKRKLRDLLPHDYHTGQASHRVHLMECGQSNSARVKPDAVTARLAHLLGSYLDNELSDSLSAPFSGTVEDPAVTAETSVLAPTISYGVCRRDANSSLPAIDPPLTANGVQASRDNFFRLFEDSPFGCVSVPARIVPAHFNGAGVNDLVQHSIKLNSAQKQQRVHIEPNDGTDYPPSPRKQKGAFLCPESYGGVVGSQRSISESEDEESEGERERLLSVVVSISPPSVV